MPPVASRRCASNLTGIAVNQFKSSIGNDGSIARRSITQNVVAMVCAVLTALQPLSGYANELVRAVPSGEGASAHILPIAYGDAMLPLPQNPWDKSVSLATFVPKAWTDGPKVGTAPDLTPSIISPSASYVPGASRDVVIEIKELAGVATSGLVKFSVPRADGVFSYTFLPTQTTANALAVNNPDWNASLIGTVILFQSKAALPAGAVSRIGLGTVALAPGGVANLTANIVPDPAETITSNNSTTLPISTSNVNPATTSTTSLSVPASAYAGTSVTLTATVTPTVAGNSPTGTVSFGEGANTFCPYATLVGTTTKTASCMVPAAYVTAGTHTYKALYAGSAAAGSSSITAALTVLANALPTITVTQPTAAGVSINYGAGYTIIASGNDTDQGVASIQVYDNGSPLESLCTYAASANTPRTCSAALPGLAALGAHNITATAIDGVGAAITSSPPVTITVNAVQPSGCQISGPTSLTANVAGTWGVTCTGGSPITSYSWTRTPSGFTATTQSITDTPFTGTTPTFATYNVVVSNTAGSASVVITVANSSSNTPPQVVSIIAPSTALVASVPTSITVRATDNTALGAGSLTLNAATNTMTGATITCPGGLIEDCTVNWTPPGAGIYTLGLTLTDSQGVSSNAASVFAVSEAVTSTKVQPPATAAIGSTAGQFAVSDSGAATYSIPITVAPGVNGLQPGLALSYNSQSGDGPVGVGWNLSGLSAITRCPKTIATDGIREPINYDNIVDPISGNDAFCLDGQRLIPVPGSTSTAPCTFNGTSTTCATWEFRTEIENYSRIIGIGDNTVPGNPGSGPMRFQVYTKAGQILEYGSRWWGASKSRPANSLNLVFDYLVNPGFEDSPTSSSCFVTGATSPVWPQFPAGCPVLPGFQGYFLLNSDASSTGWTFASGGYSQNSAGGVARVNSNLAPPFGGEGVQAALVQGRGTMTSTGMYLEAGKYDLSFLLAGRPQSGGTTDFVDLYDGVQAVEVKVRDNSTNAVASIAVFSTSTASGYISRTAFLDLTPRVINGVNFGGSGSYSLIFAGLAPLGVVNGVTKPHDGTAYIDQIRLVPQNTDIYSIKLFPLDHVEDRNGNFMNIDYGGTHQQETVVDSFGNAVVSLTTLNSGRTAQGARPALEMYPRRITYGMRSGASASDVELARVILNYECRDGQPADSTRSCAAHNSSTLQFDTGSGQLLLSKRLKSIVTLVGGNTDDTSTARQRADFHLLETGANLNELGSSLSYLCDTGNESACGSKLRSYTLTYGTSTSSARPTLTFVSECGSDGVCLPSTQFSWQSDGGVTLFGPNSGGTASGANIDWNFLYAQGQVADVVGDGRSRMVVRKSNSVLGVCELAGASFTCTDRAIPAGFYLPDATSTDDHAWTLADVDGDGIADLVVTPRSKNGTRAFACIFTSGAYQCSELPAMQGTRGGSNSPDARYYSKTADFNGDGRIDVAFYRGNGVFEICLAPFAAARCTFANIEGLNIAFANVANEQPNQLIADFNGDGRADIAYRVSALCVEHPDSTHYDSTNRRCVDEPNSNDMYWSVCFAAGADNAMRFECATRSGANVLGAVKTVAGDIKKIANYDFNGDGLADFATANKVNGAVSGWRVCLSTGDGEFANRDTNGECPIWGGPSGDVDKTVVGDFNGDGRTDLAYFVSGSNGQPGTWEVCLSTGAGFQTCTQVSGPPKPANCTGNCNEAFPGDFNGDGKTDIAVNGFGTNGTLYHGLPSTVMPDLLSAVTNGLQAQTRINYLPLTDSVVYTKSPPNITALNTADEIDIQSPMYVVRSTCASTGNANSDWYKSQYFYGGLRADKWGRGLYGFFSRSIVDNLTANSSCTTTDSSAAQTTAILNSHAWPNIGRPLAVAKTVANPYISPAAPNAVIVVSSNTAEYGARCRDASGTIQSSCPANSTPGYRWEPLQLKTTQSGNDLPPAANQPSVALPTTTTYTGITTGGVTDIPGFYDSFGNPLQVVSRVDHPSTVERWEQTVTNTYHAPSTNQWLIGKLATASTVSAVSGYVTNGAASVTRTASFGYQGINSVSCVSAINVTPPNGTLCTETIESAAYNSASPPYNDRSLWQQTAYEYDAYGNRNKSTVSFFADKAGTGGVQTRSSETLYLAGRYPTTFTRKFIGAATRDLVETRDYGTILGNRCRQATTITDANGNYATVDFDGFCRKVSEAAYTKDAGLVKQTTYALAAATGNESYSLTASSLDGGQSITYYDNLQRAVRNQTRTFAGGWSAGRVKFDALGRQVCSGKTVAGTASSATVTCGNETWAPAAGESIGRVTALDALNRVLQETLPDGETVTTAFNGLTTKVTRSNSTGSTGSVGSIQAHVVTKTANAKGLVDTISTDTLVTTVSNRYDAAGNLSQVSSPGPGPGTTTLTKTMSYDLRGRQTQLVDPDAGTYSYIYNGVGEQVSQGDSQNNTTTTQYDPFGRKTQRTESHPAGLAQTTWRYGDESGQCANARGLLCNVTYSVPGVADSVKAMGYDKYSRPATTSTTIDGKTFVSQIAYDFLGRPKYAIYPQATTAAAPLSLLTSYNSYGYTSEVKHATTGQSYWRVDGRSVDGQLATATQGGVLSIAQSYGTDGLARLATINVNSGATPLLTQSFQFESVGNLKQRSLSSAVGASAARNEVETFGYDVLDRLASAGVGNLNQTVWPDSGNYTIDLAGNLTNKAGITLGYQTSSNRLCNIGSSSCSTSNVVTDSTGNITSYTRPLAGVNGVPGTAPGADGASLTLSGYTAFNLPTQVSKTGGSGPASAAFFYDAGYQRIRQIKRAGPIGSGPFVDDILYVVPGGFEVHRDVNGNVVQSIATVGGPDGVVATVNTSFDANTGVPLVQNSGSSVSNSQSGVNTVTRLVFRDHLGSVVGEITLSGTVAVPTVIAGSFTVRGYGPWGNARNGLAPDQRGFTGHEHLAELGLIHMNGRLYDPVIGRFLQADPVIQAPHNAQSHNRYSYVLNNPLSLTDPSGFSWWTKNRGAIIGLAVGLLTGGIMAAYGMVSGILGFSGTIFATGSGSLTVLGAATAAAAGGFAAGGINGGNIQSALRGAFTAFVTAGVLQGLGEFLSQATSSVPELASGPAAQHLVAGGDSVTQAINSTPNLPSQMQIPVSDVPSELPQGSLRIYRPEGSATAYTDKMVITGSRYNDWVANGLDWVGRQASDRGTIIGAVWMGAQAFPGARGVSALRAGQAGRFSLLDNLRVTGDRLTPHHMPQAAANFTSRAEGGALVMTQTEHAATRTFGGKGALTSRLEAEMSFRDVLARDINDVRSIVGTRYNEGLKDLLEYYRKNFPELIAKP